MLQPMRGRPTIRPAHGQCHRHLWFTVAGQSQAPDTRSQSDLALQKLIVDRNGNRSDFRQHDVRQHDFCEGKRLARDHPGGAFQSSGNERDGQFVTVGLQQLFRGRREVLSEMTVTDLSVDAICAVR